MRSVLEFRSEDLVGGGVERSLSTYVAYIEREAYPPYMEDEEYPRIRKRYEEAKRYGPYTNGKGLHEQILTASTEEE